MLLQVHLADDLVVAGPAEGLPIVVARQLVSSCTLCSGSAGRLGGSRHPSPHGTPPEDKEALGVIDEDPVAALTHRELVQVLCARAASGAARVYRAGGGGGRLGGAQMAAQAQAAAAAQTAAATPTQTP